MPRPAAAEAAPDGGISAAAPLAGVRIVDLSRHLPGPLTTRILADLGARVLKIEEPTTGDPTRAVPPMAGSGAPGDSSTTGALAALLLAGHRSVGLDLKQEAGRDALLVLLEDADVLVESLRPGTLARLGLDPEILRARFRRLVIASISGFGQHGPHASRAGHDLTYQALAGSLASVPAAPAVPVADVTGAWSAATAITAALLRRGSTGDGCWIDQALADAAGHAALTGWAEETGGSKAVGEGLSLTGGIPCYKVYPTADGGYFALACLEPKFWRRFCTLVDHPQWIPRQLSSQPAFHQQVAELVASRSRQAWSAFFADHDLPGEAVLSLAEAREHPQIAHRAVTRLADDGAPRLAYPALFDGHRPQSADTVPALGEHTEAVLTAHGIPLPKPPSASLRTRARRWLTGLAGKLTKLDKLTRR